MLADEIFKLEVELKHLRQENARLKVTIRILTEEIEVAKEISLMALKQELSLISFEDREMALKHQVEYLPDTADPTKAEISKRIKLCQTKV
jgi:hypothetical protein